jgi:hypothetical protein
MEWLPGTSIFQHHTPVFWLSLITGTGLGALAGRLRTTGTVYEGRHWILWMSGLAGAVTGTTLFLFLSLASLLANARSGGGRAAPVAVWTVLGQLALFMVFVLRRVRR